MSSKMLVLNVNVLRCYFVVAAVLCLYFLFTFLCLCLFFVFVLLCLYLCVYIFCVCVYIFVFVLLCLERWAAHALEATAATTLTNSLLVAVVLIFNDLLYIQTNNFGRHSWKSRFRYRIIAVKVEAHMFICYIFLLSLMEI